MEIFALASSNGSQHSSGLRKTIKPSFWRLGAYRNAYFLHFTCKLQPVLAPQSLSCSNQPLGLSFLAQWETSQLLIWATTSKHHSMQCNCLYRRSFFRERFGSYRKQVLCVFNHYSILIATISWRSFLSNADGAFIGQQRKVQLPVLEGRGSN